MAQPTLSAAIKNLEETLGAILVHRTSRYQGLTPEGERVLEWAKRLAGDARAMREEVRAFRKGLTGQLRLAVIPSALPYASELTAPYRALHPGVQISVLSRSSAEIVDMLGDLQADAGITYLGTETIGRLRALPLYTERYRLLTTQAGPMGSRPEVEWAELRDLPLCLPTPDMQNRRLLNQLLAPPGHAAMAAPLESDSMIVLLSHVRHGGWVTIVSERVAETLAGSGAVSRHPDHQPRRRISDRAGRPDAGADAAIAQGVDHGGRARGPAAEWEWQRRSAIGLSYCSTEADACLGQSSWSA